MGMDKTLSVQVGVCLFRSVGSGPVEFYPACPPLYMVFWVVPFQVRAITPQD